jgi:hypothetical protein
MPLTISLQPNPNSTNGKKSLNAFPYDSNPPWRTIRDNVTITFSTIVTIPSFSFNLLNLSSFSNWNSSFASTIYSTTILSSYRYRFDGTSNSISDGGDDMWDSGNFISLTFSNLRNLSTLNYGRMSTFSNSATGLLGGFFLSPANQWPQTGLAYIKNGSIGWTNSGNVGSDGQLASSNSNISGTYMCPGGRYGKYWVNQNFNTTDPTICYTWYTIEQSNYGTVITSCNDNRKRAQPPADIYAQNFNLTGSNILFAQTLLSVRTIVPTPAQGFGYFIPSTTIEGFLSTYVESAVLNFS